MLPEVPIAFADTAVEPASLEIRVNFGMFAGREATPAEIDELARVLVPEVGDVEIVSEHRYEIGPEAEAEVHQVRVEVDRDALPQSGDRLEELTDHLVEVAARWARACVADRHIDVPQT